MLPVGVQRFVAGSYSSALVVYAPPPATSTRPSKRRTAMCNQRGWFSVPPGSHVPVDGSYSSVVDSPTPPTTRMRPLASRVAVMERDPRPRLLVRGVAEVIELALAVVVQDHGEPAAGIEPKRELRADARQPRLFDIDRHTQPPSASLETGNSRRPISFDSFISATPIVAVIRT